MKTMFIITVSLLLLILIWHFATRKYVDSAECIAFIGARGTGKSATKTKMIYDSLKKGIPTYTDQTDVYLDGLRICDVYDLGRTFTPNSNFFIDEVNRYFDNRSYQSKEYLEKANAFLEWLRYVRKLHCNVYIYTQSYDFDKKLRTNLSDIILLKKWFRVFTIGRKLKKFIYLKDTATEADTQIAQKLEFEPIFVKRSLTFTFLPKWIHKFDSYNNVNESKVPLNYKLVENGKVSDVYYNNADEIEAYEKERALELEHKFGKIVSNRPEG